MYVLATLCCVLWCSLVLLITRCTWFYCSGCPGFCEWSVQVKEQNQLSPTAKQIPVARPYLLQPPPPLLSPPQLRPSPRQASAPCRPAWCSWVTLSQTLFITGPMPRQLCSPTQATKTQAPIHTFSLMATCPTWASLPLQNWNHCRGAESSIMAGTTVGL